MAAAPDQPDEFPDSRDGSAPGIRFSVVSHTGRVRRGNEDFYAISPGSGIFAVCDGMGGAAAGEVASRLAATTFVEQLKQQIALEPPPEPTLDLARPAAALATAIDAANTAVYRQARRDASARGMGTTLVALLLEPNPYPNRRPDSQPDSQPDSEPDSQPDPFPAALWLAHVGDSRGYRLRHGALTLLTEDHSLVNEQVAAGQLTPAQAERSPMRNIITRAIGTAPQVRPDIRRLHPQPGDLYLLASDGLTRDLPDDALATLLRAPHRTLAALCRSLVTAANAAGGRDNITTLLLRFDD